MRFLRRFRSITSGLSVMPAKAPLGGVLRARDVQWDVKNETDHLAEEQVQVWKADGTKSAKAAHASAAAITPLVEGVRDLQDSTRERIEDLATIWSDAIRRLQGFTPLTVAETRRYWITFLLLVGGDVCAVTGGAVALGEIPIVAFLQALGSGMAAATSGLVASELRKRQMAHLFPVERPAEGQAASEPFTVFGLDPDDLVFRIAIVLVGALIVAIVAMRWVQDPGAAVAFSLLAFVTCAGSFINNWVHTRPAAEILEGYRLAYEEATNALLALSGHPALSQQASSLSEASSIVTEHDVRGEAAKQHVLAQFWATLRRHPNIFGHGTEGSAAPVAVPPPVAPFDAAARHNGVGSHHTDLSARPLTGRR